jgi:hypothetical protein
VLFKAFPKWELPDFTYKEYKDGESEMRGEKLSIPSERTKGEWQDIVLSSEEEEENKYRFYYLQTLSGLIWHGTKGGKLYRAQFEGKSIKLDHFDYFWYSNSSPDDEMSPLLQARVHIDNCIDLGLKARKARLTSEVKNWTPYLLWSFAIDCVERQCLIEEGIPDIYIQGLAAARNLAKLSCGVEKTAMENFTQLDSNSDNFEEISNNKISELSDKIYAEYKKSFGHNMSLGKAVKICLENPPFNPFQAAMEIRVMCAQKQGQYHSLYDYPSLITAKTQEDEKVRERIWHALMKQELDWQVQHLAELLDE